MKSLLVLALCGCGSWTAQDTGRQGLFATELAVDLIQTRAITARCDEVNPIVGRCGENLNPGVYMLSAFIAHTAIAAVLPKRWRAPFQWISIGVEGGTVVNNEAIRLQGY